MQLINVVTKGSVILAIGLGVVLGVATAQPVAASENPIGPFWGRPYPYGYAYIDHRPTHYYGGHEHWRARRTHRHTLYSRY